MSSIEERLARDIAAVTGGIVVTESDLFEAHSSVYERIEGKRRRDRVRIVAASAAAVVVLAGAGVVTYLAQGDDDETSRLATPPTTGSDPDAGYLTGSLPTPELVKGVWRLDDGNTALQFQENGTVLLDNRGTLFSDPPAVGTYAIDGGRITVTISAAQEASCVGTEVVLRASFPEPGSMRFVASDSDVTCSQLPFGRGALEQVLPTSEHMTELVLSTESGWRPVTDGKLLQGVWLAEGGGYLLELNAQESYYLADDAGLPIDQGRWSLRGSELTLTSSARSTRCSGGDVLVLSGVEWVNFGTYGIRGTVQQNTCGAAWTPASWILIPHQGT